MSSVESLSTTGPCQLAERLGFNGAVATYKGVLSSDLQNVCVVALDRARFKHLPAVSRFRDEFERIVSSKPSGIANAIAHGEDPGYYWAAFQFLKGVHLGIHVRDKGLPTPPDAVSVIASTVGALMGLHDMGIPHRVITPASIFIKDPGEVRLMHAGWGGLLLGVESGPANPAFMSNLPFLAPEVARGEEGSLASDIYSLGANLYFLVTGQPTMWADDPAALAASIGSTPVDLSGIRDSVPWDLADLLEEMLAFDPDERPLNLEALKERMDMLAEQLMEGTATPDAPPDYSAAVAPLMSSNGDDGDSSMAETYHGEPETDPETSRLLELAKSARDESQRISSASVEALKVIPPFKSDPTPANFGESSLTAIPPPPLPTSYKSPPPTSAYAEAPPRKFSPLVLAAVGVVVLLLLGGGAWGVMSFLSSGSERPTRPTGTTTQQPRGPRQPSAAEQQENFNVTVTRLRAMATAQRGYAEKYGVWVNHPNRLEEFALSADALLDGWETAMEYRQRFTISAGPDKKWDTEDDLWINSETMEQGGWAP